MSLDKIKHNILSIKQTLSTLSSISTNCTLLCVTKYASTQQILNLYEAGERHFGENKVQDTEKNNP